MAQKTSWTGASATESDINTYLMHEGGAWTTYVPVVTQSGTPPLTVNRAAYGRAGRFIYGSVSLTITGAGGVANNFVSVSTPVTASATVAGVLPVGSGLIRDDSAVLYYPQIVVMKTTTTFAFFAADVASNVYAGQTGSTFALALASPDTIQFHFMYEAAT